MALQLAGLHDLDLVPARIAAHLRRPGREIAADGRHERVGQKIDRMLVGRPLQPVIDGVQRARQAEIAQPVADGAGVGDDDCVGLALE